ncbi:hypothetical protein ADL22_16355 [Streptomyces sp. NRRL F-4489]|uniref:hypothetical protein n=1 Tax=Streptomyces sp. NRRL F-4489 TaxID=1609095 RepID=UPI0007494712|nr:hypothetical protein [Streptomyces sp. NRRL F-4489]KUL38838.1 hypothetical protein ADL22_16355 [Streptomyces sp. NRRL F-4489]
MTDKQPAAPADPDRTPVGHGPWWAGLGPIGGAALLVLGLGLAAYVFLWGGGSLADTRLYGAAKVVAIGLVVLGTTLLSRRRGTPASDDGDAT